MKRLIALLFAASLALAPLLATAAPVNINTADAKTIETGLVGVGPKTAKAIVDYRAKHGAFKSVDELAKVKGIGPKLVEKNRANLVAQ
jgi:competence protein ComEA